MLSGENGIIERAGQAKESMQIATEKEAISIESIQLESTSGKKQYIGKELYDKDLGSAA